MHSCQMSLSTTSNVFHFTAIEDPHFHLPTCPTPQCVCPPTAAPWTSTRCPSREQLGTVLSNATGTAGSCTDHWVGYRSWAAAGRRPIWWRIWKPVGGNCFGKGSHRQQMQINSVITSRPRPHLPHCVVRVIAVDKGLHGLYYISPVALQEILHFIPLLVRKHTQQQVDG